MFHHCESFHSAYSKLVILFGQSIVFVLKLSNGVFQASKPKKVCLESHFNLLLELIGPKVLEFSECSHLSPLLISHTKGEGKLLG